MGVWSVFIPTSIRCDMQSLFKESIEKTCAVVMGRKTFAMGDPDSYAGNYEYQVPIFVEGYGITVLFPPDLSLFCSAVELRRSKAAASSSLLPQTPSDRAVVLLRSALP